MLSLEVKNTILSALAQYRGDDLERAKAAFRGCSPAQMQEQYGASGKTRAEIVADYQRHADRVSAAVAAIKAL